MNLITPVNIVKPKFEIAYTDNVLLLGSCFTEHILSKMQSVGMSVNSNPFGVMYNPLSIAQCIKILLGKATMPPAVQYDGLWHSMMHHGSFSRADRQEFDKLINRSIEQGREALVRSDVLIITFGTAWVYSGTVDGELHSSRVVSNCHKMPERWFQRRRLTVEEIVEEYTSLLSLPELKDKKVVFTVSPIRHQRDGLHANQLSKATLLLAIDQLRDATYFPAYEIVLDELRDYRFFAEDMCHPSAVAIDYVWEKFSATFFSTATIEQVKQEYKLFLRTQHRPLHDRS